MNPFVAGVILVLAALVQVTVAPLFTLSAAEPDMVLLALVVIAAFAGPYPVMWALPVAAVAMAFLTNRDPAFLVFAYLPLLPVAYAVERGSMPLNASLRVVLCGLAVGGWARGVLAVEAILDGADASLGVLVGQLLIPGLFLDFALLGIAVVAARLIGWEPRTMALYLPGYQPR